jgi:hypothetical protein
MVFTVDIGSMPIVSPFIHDRLLLLFLDGVLCVLFSCVGGRSKTTVRRKGRSIATGTLSREAT